MTSATASLLGFVWKHPENEEGRLRAITRVILWQLWQRAVGRPLLVSMPGGLRLKCYPHSTAATGVLYCRLPEWQDMRFMLGFLQPGDVFVDVGANVGVYSLLASAVPGVDSWAFEPSSCAFERLRENVSLNALESRVVTRHAAVGAEEGRSSLTTGRDTVNRLIRPGEEVESEEVELVSLDAVLGTTAKQSVSLVKVDVEGFEEDVLKGAGDLLREVGPVLIVEANDRQALAGILRPLGYQRYSYDPRTGQLSETDWFVEGPGNNLLAIRDEGIVRARMPGVTLK